MLTFESEIVQPSHAPGAPRFRPFVVMQARRTSGRSSALISTSDQLTTEDEIEGWGERQKEVWADRVYGKMIDKAVEGAKAGLWEAVKRECALEDAQQQDRSSKPRQLLSGTLDRCPACRKLEGVPIVYGFPDEAAFEAADREEIVLGGCLVTGHEPNRFCKKCSHKWTVDGSQSETS